MLGTYIMAISAATFSAFSAFMWITAVNHFDPKDVAPPRIRQADKTAA
jgi:hypothetical protein